MCAAIAAQHAPRGHIQLLLQVARMYYEEDRGQQEIADTIGYSRPTVSRLLAEAKERRIVRFTVAHPLEQALELEERLRRTFGLRLAAVASQDGADPVQSVGRLAANVIAENGNPHTMLALSNGRSVAAVVDSMPSLHWPYSCVTQMIGSLGSVDHHLVDGPDLCRRMSERLGGQHRPLPVPIVLASAVVAASVKKEELVITTLELAARSDIAICGVGSVGPRGTSGMILQPFMTPEIDAQVKRGKAVAHICGHHFDAEGRHVRTSLCDRMISMPPERLADVKMSMVVAWGPEKVPALRAVMQTGFVNALTTDEQTAQLLLTYEPRRAR
ncbi:MAG: sugar-binding protein [Cellulomonas sp.]|uniref:sugar-binding transcriptional regulator n=1 Tax=Cellulomonas sp. TaxID=40001 RepID=UPI0017B9D162|nr:sugar-binding domain-containing protein [Cellulomonas sp.]NMM16726.1 sugar-binding protein [Cellulomonas sp.]NMM29520.1 sugar-binding protein [Cellulomonas sp.]